MDAEELIRELAWQLGITLQFTEAGVCRVYFDDDAVDFEKTGPSLCLIAEVGATPAHAREAVYTLLLEANLFGIETAGATLGLDAPHDTIFLHRNLGNILNYAEFETALEHFVKVLRHWKQILMEQHLHQYGATGSQPLAGLKV